jgi:hypothetical protein
MQLGRSLSTLSMEDGSRSIFANSKFFMEHKVISPESNHL